MPTPWLSRGLLLAAAAGVFAAARAGPVRELLLPPPPAAEARLDEVLPEVHLRADTLAEALDALRRQTGAKIVVDPSVKADLSLGSLEIDARNVMLGQVLNQVLNACDGRIPPAYSTDGKTILVTNPDILTRYSVTRIYDVRDLLPENATPPPPTTRPASNICFPGQAQSPRREAVDGMTSLITQLVAAESWWENGGTSGNINELDGRLIVLQTPENHCRIASLLEGWRASPGVWQSSPYVGPNMLGQELKAE